jgi:hypothetical protein
LAEGDLSTRGVEAGNVCVHRAGARVRAGAQSAGSLR